MTVEEFRALPEDSGGLYHELRHGEVVAVTRPKFKYHLVQSRLRDLLKAAASPSSFVELAVAFRPLSEHELWVADVAYLSPSRFAEVNPEDNVTGAPDLVIEVLSPSNTVDEMNERERMCLDHGSLEFWVVDQTRRQVKVSTPDGHTVTYRSGQEIPLWLSDGKTLSVDAIFG